MEIEEIAYAKINLGLRVTGRDAEGYHELDTTMVPVDLGERIRLQRAEGIAIAYTNGRGYAHDVCIETARAFLTARGLPGVRIFVEKKIPEGWGLGGSSADAAALLRGLKQLYRTEDPSEAELVRYGSDVPFLYRAIPARCKGRGEKIFPVALKPLWVAIAGKRGRQLSSVEVFRRYDAIGEQCEEPYKGFSGVLANALERSALSLAPDIERGKEALKRAGFDLVTLTGSGSAYIGGSWEENSFRAALGRLELPEGFSLLTARTEGRDKI